MSCWEFDTEELKMLINGQFTFRRCGECHGLGYEWYNTTTGVVVPEPKEDLEDYDTEMCFVCKGLGGRIKFE